jgi:N-acetylglucosamine kinase-like BadF-type ATPase
MNTIEDKINSATFLDEVEGILRGADIDDLEDWYYNTGYIAVSLDGSPDPDPLCHNAGIVAYDATGAVYLDFQSEEIVHRG